MIKTILLAVDGSSTAQKAADYAVWLAKNIDAKVLLFHVLDETRLRTLFSLADGGVAPAALDLVEQNLKEGAETYICAFERQFKEANIVFESVIVGGTPSREIVKEAETRNVDLIVMGSHGRGRLGASILGSVAYGVIHHDSKIPVMIVRKS